MNLRNKIIKSKDNDYEEMAGAVESMRNINRHFNTGTLPNQDFSLTDLKKYIFHLIDIQEKDGSWTVASSIQILSGDETVEFVTYPSYLALGSLVLVAETLPEESFEGIENALVKGFQFIKLEGYGEDTIFQIIEMVLMLIESGIPPWLAKRKGEEIFYNTTMKLISFRDRLQSRLDAGDTVLSYGGDYKSIFELVVSGLAVL